MLADQDAAPVLGRSWLHDILHLSNGHIDCDLWLEA